MRTVSRRLAAPAALLAPLLARLLAADASLGGSSAQETILAQELRELEALLRLSGERVELLERLQSGLAESGAPEAVTRALRAELPLVSEVSMADPRLMPVAAAEDFLTSKARIRFEKPAALIRFLPVRVSLTFSAKEAPLAPPPCLLVVAHPDGDVQFIAPSGELLLLYSTGHHRPITTLAVSPSWAQGDTLVATGDTSGAVRIHRVFVKQQRISRIRSEDTASLDNDSALLGASIGSSVNVTVVFQRQLEPLGDVDGEAPRMTALAMASQQGSKYFVVGDAEGKVSVFSLDGSFRSRLDATVTPGAAIDSFYVHMSQLIFTAGSEWGYIDLEALSVKHVECPDFDAGRIAAAVIDSRFASRVVVADDEGDIWVLTVRKPRTCRVDHRFPKGLARSTVELASIRGFLLMLERVENSTDGRGAVLTALNMSHVGKQELDLPWSASPVVWRITRPAVRSWTTFRHRQEQPLGDVVALMSADGMDVEIFDLFMQIYTPPPEPPLYLNSWVMIPTVVSVVIAAVSWHYVKYGRPKPKDVKAA